MYQDSNFEEEVEVAEALAGVQALILPIQQEIEYSTQTGAGYSPATLAYNTLIEELFDSSSDRDLSPPTSPRLTYSEFAEECGCMLAFP